MEVANDAQGKRKLPGSQGFLARGVDLVLIVAGAIIASRTRFEYLADGHVEATLLALAAALALVFFPKFEIYRSWRGRSMLNLAGQISLAWLLVQGCGLVLMFSLHRTDFISRLWFAYWTGITGGMLIVVRLVAHTVLRRIRYAGLDLRKVAVVGCGTHCQQVLRNIETFSDSGFRATAAFVLRPVAVPTSAGMSIFDDFGEFADHVRTEGVREIWLTLPLSEERTILRFINEFRDDLVNIRFVPDVSSLALFDSRMIDLIGVPAINLIASPLSPSALLKKAIFDRVFAACALIALTPLMIAIAVAVKLSSRGPIFFRQRRKGADGHVFEIYKYRTMRLHVEEAGVVKQATRSDPRITRVGAFLRRTSLDELPQFFNVLRGEMSVVGPRPHAIEHDEFYQKLVKGYIHRYRVKPGITGWAQVNGYRGETDRIEKMQRRVEHDLFYLRNWSFAFDLRIVGATILKGFTDSSAY